MVTSHSDKENARPTFKRGYGFHPLTAGGTSRLRGIVDHGVEGTGEPLAMQLRPGNAGSNTAVDHIEFTRTSEGHDVPPRHRNKIMKDAG